MDAESDLDRLKRELEEKSRLLEESLERERNKTRTLSPEKYYVYLADEIESRKTFPEIARRYKRMAERIRGDPSARKFIDSLYDGFMEGMRKDVFNALCVPSGTGKTQLAFSLPQDRSACIYLNMHVKALDRATGQSVYDAFRGYMPKLIDFLRYDFELSERTKTPRLRLYAFFHALVKLLIRVPDLDLPFDLARLRISPTAPECDYEEMMSETDCESVQAEIHKWRKFHKTRQSILFIDEFTASATLPQEMLAFFRRQLMNLGVCVIVASTDSGAMNMFKRSAATADSRGEVTPWVNLCTRLPKYVPGNCLREALDRCEHSAIKNVLELCIKSRPLFAESVADKITDYLANLTLGNVALNFVDFLDQLRNDVLTIMRTKQSVHSREGCFGYITAVLLAGGALLSEDSTHRSLFGDFTTKNWAYLVNDENVLFVQQPDFKQAKRQRQLKQSTASRDRWMRLSILHSKPIFLVLFRESGFGDDMDRLHFQIPNQDFRPFPCISFFPDVSEDFLLHLTLVGSAARPGLTIKSPATPERISTAKLMADVLLRNQKAVLSKNNILPSYGEHEALVCAAFFTACNSGSLHGCTLEDLVTRFVAELIIPRNRHFANLTKVDKIPLSGKWRASFAFPFDTEINREVHELLGTVQTSRPPNDQSVDAVTYTRDSSGEIRFQVIVEAKSTTNSVYVHDRITHALQCQDSNAKVSFIVTDKCPDGTMLFKPEEFYVLDRSKKVGKTWQKGKRLDARVFFVEINESGKVVLKAIDGKPKGQTAERVIFVISRSEIDRRFQ